MLSQWVLAVILFLLLSLVISNKLRIEIAALSMAIFLGILQFAGMGMLGQPDTKEAAILCLSGFGQPVVITLISLFILSYGLEKSGLMRWVARKLIKIGGSNERKMIGLLAFTSAFFSLFINNVAAGILVLPSAMEISRRTGIKPSKLLIPVSFGSLVGGMATYFTTANIIMSDLLVISNPPQAPLQMLDFFPTGGLIVILVILLLVVLGPWILPSRQPSAEQTFTCLTGSELESLYNINERLWEIRITRGSAVIGKTIEEAGFGHIWGVTIIAIRGRTDEYILPCASRVIKQGDILLVIGKRENVKELDSLKIKINSATENGFLSPHGILFAEVILTPHSKAQGKDLIQLDFRQRYGLNVVAIQHQDDTIRSNIGQRILSLGDSLLVAGTPNQFKLLKKSPDFIVFDTDLGDQPIQIRTAILSSILMLAAITISALGIPVYLCVFAAAIISVFLKVVEPEEAYQSINWQTIFTIAGMYVVSLAMVNTGLASWIGNHITSLVMPFGLLGVTSGAFLLSALLTQVMGGQISAMVSGPIMLSAALLMHVNPHAVAVSAAIGCSASFLTPIAHPVNILMVAPANYRFSDFFRAGWLPMLLSFLTLLLGIILFWS